MMTRSARAAVLPLFAAAVSAAVTGALLLPSPGRAQQPDQPYRIKGLVVTASPTPRPLDALATHVTVLDGASLRAQGFSRVQEALRQVPGLDIVQGGSPGSSSSLFLRGGESDYTLVLLDGVPLNQPGGSVDLSALTLNDVERIEVVRGPASALYGSDAVTGVVQIITKSGGGPTRLRADARGGTYGRREWSTNLSGEAGPASYSLGASRTATDGVLPFNNQWENTVLDGTALLRLPLATTGRLTLRWMDHTYHFPTDGAGNLVDHNQATREKELVAGAELTRFVGRALELHAQAGLDRSIGGTDDPPDGPADTLGFFASTSDDHVHTASGRIRASYHFDGAVATAGWELEQESQRSYTTSRSQWGDSSDRSRYERWNRAWFAYLTGRAGPTTYDVGARLEDNERFGRLGTWQAGLTWRPLGSGGPRLRASAGLGIKEPTFYENYATGFARGNPDLDPERARSWEVGADQSLAGGRVEFQASYFDQRFRDLIQYTASPPDPQAPSFYNVAKAAASGVELGARAELGPLGIHGSWTRLRTRVLDAGLDSGPGAAFVEGQRLLRRPTNTADFGTTYAVGRRATLSADLHVVGSREDRDFSTYPATPVVLARYENLTAGARVRVWGRDGRGAPASGGGAAPGRGYGGGSRPPGGTSGSGPGALTVDLTVRGANLLNQAYQEVSGFPAPGRTLLIGARVALGG